MELEQKKRFVSAFWETCNPSPFPIQTMVVKVWPTERFDYHDVVLIDMSEADGRFQIIDDNVMVVPAEALVRHYAREDMLTAERLEDFMARLKDSQARLNQPLPPRKIRRSK